MTHWKIMLENKTIRLMDHTNITSINGYPFSGKTSFALDDMLIISVGDYLSPPTIRMWRHPQTIVLGIPDSRLPYIEDAIRMLHHHQYNVLVRNTGGLAVALDEGMINLSLVLPHMKHFSIYDYYKMMVTFVQDLLRDLTTTIQAYEIVGSYCPGEFDLSIDGVKFAGISQRRIKNGVAVQIYIDICGESRKHATIIQSFYETGIKGEKTKFTYPNIDPNKMDSLTHLLRKELTIEKVIDRIKQTLASVGEKIISTPLSQSEQNIFAQRYEQMDKRNESIKQLFIDGTI